MKICTIAAVLFLTLTASAAYADDKFTQMDSSKDGKVTWDEFHAAYPQMQQAAFDGIDANKDKVLTHEEWDAFLTQHNMGRAGAPGGMGKSMGSMPPKAMPDGKKGESPSMMITPPAQK